MKIQFFTYSNGNFLNGQNHINNLNKNVTLPQSLNNNKVDSFTKSTKEVSFHGVEKKNKTKDVLSDLAAIGIIGAPFVLSIGAGCYVMNKMNPKDIFLPDGTYFMSTEQMKTPVITADTDEGILKIEGTPIDIDASKYDIADIEHGIFKNFDGSVDIDLANNKYIDMHKGVIIDPEHNLSFIKDASGEIHNLVLPDLNSPNFEGASIGTVNPVHLRQTREEYINQHHSKPEDDLSNIYSDNNRIPNSASDRVVEPDDNRNLAQKIMDFFNPLSPDSRVNNLFDRSKNYDVFGREILTISKPDGSISKVAIDEDLKAVLDKYHLKEESLGEIADFFDKIKLKEYLLEYHPVESLDFGVHIDSLQEFLHKISETHSDVAEIITNDAITETLNDPETHTSLLDTFKEIFENITN